MTVAAKDNKPAPAEPDHDADLAHLRSLLAADHTGRAAELVKTLAERWPDSERIQHYARVLAPPVVTVRPGPPGPDHRADFVWIRDNARNHPGLWLTLRDGRLVASAVTLAEAQELARRELGDGYGVLMYQAPRETDGG